MNRRTSTTRAGIFRCRAALTSSADSFPPASNTTTAPGVILVEDFRAPIGHKVDVQLALARVAASQVVRAGCTPDVDDAAGRKVWNRL
jgi:hypothetical protein